MYVHFIQVDVNTEAKSCRHALSYYCNGVGNPSSIDIWARSNDRDSLRSQLSTHAHKRARTHVYTQTPYTLWWGGVFTMMWCIYSGVVCLHRSV